MKKGYKECPFCANEIKENAVKCQHCGEYLDATLRNKQSRIAQIIKYRSDAFIECPSCGYSGKGKKRSPGNGLIEIILYIPLVVPGIFYSLYRRNNSVIICPKCKSDNLYLDIEKEEEYKKKRTKKLLIILLIIFITTFVPALIALLVN